MPRRNNPVLGTITCNECGGQATVHQTQRGKGRYLYTRCMECGPDQRTGAALQRRLWFGTDWRPEAEAVIPPNVDPDAAPAGEPQQAAAEPEPEPVNPGSEPGKPSGKGLIGLAIAGGLLLMGIVGS